MGEIRKTYNVSFKKKTVNLYLKKGIGYKNVAREMEIDASLVQRWVRRFRAEGIIDIFLTT
ncbi:transposase [Paenibacillus polymyxa]|uniref:transposase n=1 Tax=Paenibacillus polymyxa TaxID=1406 RepID=UPI00287F7C0A|nr:transposase [Paenibacillus polymyxa]